jgi:hypothetical protein
MAGDFFLASGQLYVSFFHKKLYFSTRLTIESYAILNICKNKNQYLHKFLNHEKSIISIGLSCSIRSINC